MGEFNLLLAGEASFAEWLLSRPWIISIAIVVIGLGIYGLRDLISLSFGRIWAISGVCFRDAVRRRVLWITPLAMLGIIIVSQLQRPFDEADAIRLTIKFCFFATALVVTVIAIITAATNLPREIENRVIFTIVTKPVTRLEIVIGKLVGFARVTGLILLIMGIFSLAYLHLRAWSLERGMATRDDAPVVGDVSDAASSAPAHGLLFAQTVSEPVALQQYARLPEGDVAAIKGGDQDAIYRFDLPSDMFVIGIELKVGFERLDVADADAVVRQQQNLPPEVAVQILDANSGMIVLSADALRRENEADRVPPPIILPDASGQQPTIVALPGETRITQVTELKSFFVQVIAQSPSHLYLFGPNAVQLKLANADGSKIVDLPAAGSPRFRGSDGRFGEQLRGPSDGVQPVAVYHFENVDLSASANGQVPFEFITQIERSGADADTQITDLEIIVKNRESGVTSPLILVHPESQRPLFFSVSQEAVAGGNFDVILRNKTPGHVLNLVSRTVQLVSDSEYFGVNLAKGLLVLWLFSALVSAVALCCSTRLSWPITVVLTLLIVLCRWVVANLDLGSGLGGQIANEFFPANPNSAQNFSAVVVGLPRTLSLMAALLPDISSFSAIEQIERGESLSMLQVVEPTLVLLIFGLPLLTLTYVFLRNKEVAP